MSIRNAALLALALGAVWTAGCAGGGGGGTGGGAGGGGGSAGSDQCPASSKCSADPKPTAAEIQTCQDNYDKAACKPEFNALLPCARTAQTCGSDNKTDSQATNDKITANCQSLVDAYAACITGSMDAGG